MRGLDSNVLLRFVLQDEPEQFKIASDFLAGCSPLEPAFVNLIVLCEFVWVLRSGWKLDRVEIADAVEALLDLPQVKFEREDLVMLALASYRAGAADLSDVLIGLVNIAAGCSATYTFDRKAARSADLILLT